LALTAAFDLDDCHPDSVNAFLNRLLNETVYCEFSEGCEEPGQCMLLLRALYGLHRAPKLWQDELLKNLVFNRFRRVMRLYEWPNHHLQEDPMPFLHRGGIDERITDCRPAMMESIAIFERSQLTRRFLVIIQYYANQILDNTMHFKSHVKKIHGISLRA
jgi:hypothetical protein